MANLRESPQEARERERDEARWTGEGGSGQVYRRTYSRARTSTKDSRRDTPISERRDQEAAADRAWQRYDATYGEHYGSLFEHTNG